MERISFKNIKYTSDVVNKVETSEVSGTTAEKIDLFNFYQSKDIDQTEHIGYVSGIAPYL